jgi:hypothetical protein
MLNAINQYKLDTHLGDYPEDSFIPISQENYNFFESFYGIKRQFKDEVFYYPENNIFIGRESPNSLVATIDNIIYKIYYKFHADNEDDCIAFRNRIIDYLGQYMSQGRLNNPEVQEFPPDFRLLMWKFDWGNLILEFGPVFDTSYIITSSRWRFRTKPATDSVPNRPPIPIQIGHPFEG